MFTLFFANWIFDELWFIWRGYHNFFGNCFSENFLVYSQRIINLLSILEILKGVTHFVPLKSQIIRVLVLRCYIYHRCIVLFQRTRNVPAIIKATSELIGAHFLNCRCSELQLSLLFPRDTTLNQRHFFAALKIRFQHGNSCDIFTFTWERQHGLTNLNKKTTKNCHPKDWKKRNFSLVAAKNDIKKSNISENFKRLSDWATKCLKLISYSYIAKTKKWTWEFSSKFRPTRRSNKYFLFAFLVNKGWKFCIMSVKILDSQKLSRKI